MQSKYLEGFIFDLKLTGNNLTKAFGENRIFEELNLPESEKDYFEAYGFSEKYDLLAQLLHLNFEVYEKEQNKGPVTKPGLPDCVEDREEFVSELCVEFEAQQT